MTRPIILGNSRLHIGVGAGSDIEDVYYPYVGYASHVHRISLGAFAKGRMNWLRDGWEIKQRYMENCSIGITEAISANLQLTITITDFVHPTWDVLWRKITLANQSQAKQDVRLFSYHDLHIDENPLGDTAMIDPHLKAIIHYKNDFYFAFCTHPTFTQFATGRKEWGGLEGTWKDADDGALSGNAVSNGPVDSCIGWDLNSIAPGESRDVQIFMVVARHFRDIKTQHVYSRNQGYGQALKQTQMYWQNWLSHGQDSNLSACNPPNRVQELYNRSLLILRSMCSENGAIIASSDSEIERIGGDTYDYVWPRDASWCVMALNLCGYHEITRRFFDFILSIITEKGYLLHKYYPTGLFGSTWHPVPFIQIDQSAIVLHALWNFHQTTGDIEFIASRWQDTARIADFLSSWRDETSKLPNPSWDLWEEREAVTTYSAAAVYAGLKAASNLAALVGLEDYSAKYEQDARETRGGVLNYLYDPKLGRFLRSLNPRDESLDSSFLAINSFDLLPADDQRIVNTVNAIEEQLWVKTDIGGIARYSGDGYLKASSDIAGNPWILTTLYLAIYRTDMGQLARAKQLIEWASNQASSTGLLPEQVNAHNGDPIGVLPLAWSHAAYILAVRSLAAKLVANGYGWDNKF